MRRLTVIDIGTNTILMLIAEINHDGSFQVLRDEQVIARLGKGVDEHKTINHKTFVRVLNFLKDYKALSDLLHSEKIIACGTSALRDARNREEFTTFVKNELDIAIELLSGDDEALWTYKGAISEFPHVQSKFTVIDIGGGSTEIIAGDHHTIENRRSLDIGCVRLTERFLKCLPPTKQQLEETSDFIRQELEMLREFDLYERMLIGVAGTVTTLSALHQKLEFYDPQKVSGSILGINDIRTIFDELRIKSLEEIRTIPQIAPGRADILLAGIMILLEFMSTVGFEQITVSDRGLRYGLFIRELEKIASERS